MHSSERYLKISSKFYRWWKDLEIWLHSLDGCGNVLFPLERYYRDIVFHLGEYFRWCASWALWVLTGMEGGVAGSIQAWLYWTLANLGQKMSLMFLRDWEFICRGVGDNLFVRPWVIQASTIVGKWCTHLLLRRQFVQNMLVCTCCLEYSTIACTKTDQLIYIAKLWRSTVGETRKCTCSTRCINQIWIIVTPFWLIWN